MFGIDAIEFVLLIVLAVIIFGPEKLPEFSRKAARVFVYVRDIANNAQTTLRSELGPEYADLDIKDLNPKSFVKKHMATEIAAIEEAKRDLQLAKSEITDAARTASAEVSDAQAAAKGLTAAAAVAAIPAEPVVRYDVEAT